MEGLDDLESCEKKFPFCEKEETADQGTLTDGAKYVETCGIHESKVDFMCIPLCVNEMTPEIFEKIRTSKKYCLQQILVLGTPIYGI